MATTWGGREWNVTVMFCFLKKSTWYPNNALCIWFLNKRRRALGAIPGLCRKRARVAWDIFLGWEARTLSKLTAVMLKVIYYHLTNPKFSSLKITITYFTHKFGQGLTWQFVCSMWCWLRSLGNIYVKAKLIQHGFTCASGSFLATVERLDALGHFWSLTNL